MRISLANLALAVVLASLTLAGCGDSESSGNGDANDTGSTVTTAGGGNGEGARIPVDSKAELIEVANEICAEQRAEIQSATVAISEEDPDVAAEELFSRVVAPELEYELYGIRALDIPPSEEQQIDAILSAIEQAIVDARRDPAAAINEERPFFAKSEELAEKYGLTSCGGP